jgi:hypothetical protein
MTLILPIVSLLTKTRTSLSNIFSEDDAIVKKIRSFGALPIGWDFGQGRPSPIEVIEEAINIARIGEILRIQVEAYPGIDGEIRLVFPVGEHTIDIVVNTNLSLTLVHEIGIGINYEEVERIENASVDDIYSSITALKQESTWMLSGHLVSFDTVQVRGDSPAITFTTTTEESRYSILNALSESRRVEYVPT